MRLRAITEFFHNGKSVKPGEEVEIDGDLTNDVQALVHLGHIARVSDDAPRVAADPTPKPQPEQHETPPPQQEQAKSPTAVEPLSMENAEALVPPKMRRKKKEPEQ